MTYRLGVFRHRLRYRLATLILGYRPIPVPDKDGWYVVMREGDGSIVATASSFRLDMESPRWDNLPKYDDSKEFIPPLPGPRGTFEGTIG